MNISPSKTLVASKGKCRNITVGVIFFIIHIAAQAISMRIFRDRYVREIDEWKSTFIPTIIIEILLIDTVINPIVISMMVQCCCTRMCRRYLSPAMSKKQLT